MKRIKIKSPGTIANLVCGFDILGMALQEPYDIMELSLLEEPKIIIHNKDNFNLPTEAEKNVAGVVLLSVMEKMNNTIGFEITIEKQIKPGSGIGLSIVQRILQYHGATLAYNTPDKTTNEIVVCFQEKLFTVQTTAAYPCWWVF